MSLVVGETTEAGAGAFRDLGLLGRQFTFPCCVRASPQAELEKPPDKKSPETPKPSNPQH